MFSTIAAASFRVYGVPANELAINILTPTEGATVSPPSKTVVKVIGSIGLNIIEPIEGATVTAPSKTKISIK